MALRLQSAEVVRSPTTPARVPVATYRLQFNQRFTFRDARDIASYLDRLGISDCYASSYLKATPGSPHGYDVADPTQLNPEIGSEREYWEWIAALESHRMGHIVDLVPNHMGIAQSANPWWQDVLENGPSSRYARFFDIEWHPVKDELANKLLIPILGDQYGEVLERQELTLSYKDGAFLIRYYDNSLPIAPDTFGRILGLNLEPWLAGRGEQVDPLDADELRSVINAAEHLPPRASTEPEAIALRAREKEVIKRRLAAVLDRNAELRAFVEATLVIFNGTRGDPRSFDRLHRLLDEQSYRLAHWRVASEEINYRRFFDVNQLAALRMEDPLVFDAVHRFVFELAARGAATGFRVDHVDGLFAPADYLRRLQARTDDAGFYVVVEKILLDDEQLPPEWPVQGTTGYEFAAMVNNLFVERRNEKALDDIYMRFIRERRGRVAFDDLVYRSKKQALHETMSGDINSLGHQLNRFSERNRHFRDFTLYSLISTLKEVIACFPVYRTYVTAADPVRSADAQHLQRAIRCAKKRTPGLSSYVFDFIERLLLKQTPVGSREECEERAAFIGKFQQITSPVAAKGIEDTAHYVYNRLLSLNDVGGDPMRFGREPSEVHAWMSQRQRQYPAALSTTSTHDSKRGEDVRARLNVLSELPGPWKAAVTQWRALNRRLKREVRGKAAPEPNEEYFLYQTLVGAWPFDANALPSFKDRIRTYLTKAIREAKVNTSWLSPDEEYEAAVLHFLDAILDPQRPFLEAFLPFQSRIAALGVFNSLSQLVIKAAAPGVPDFYQGSELWDLSLVDPDNRRPVDYVRREEMLSSIPSGGAGVESELPAMLSSRADGRIKLFVTARALHARRTHARLFAEGNYVALDTAGARSRHLFAFARRLDSAWVICAVPRLVATLGGPVSTSIDRAVWEDTRLELPAELGHAAFCSIFTGARISASRNGGAGSIPAADLFARVPVAMLIAG